MELLLDGVKLMVLGMSVVFIFLVLMILLMNLMGRILAPFAGMLEAPAEAPKRTTPTGGDNDKKLAAAAAAAFHAYRAGKK